MIHENPFHTPNAEMAENSRKKAQENAIATAEKAWSELSKAMTEANKIVTAASSGDGVDIKTLFAALEKIKALGTVREALTKTVKEERENLASAEKQFTEAIKRAAQDAQEALDNPEMLAMLAAEPVDDAPEATESAEPIADDRDMPEDIDIEAMLTKAFSETGEPEIAAAPLSESDDVSETEEATAAEADDTISIKTAEGPVNGMPAPEVVASTGGGNNLKAGSGWFGKRT